MDSRSLVVKPEMLQDLYLLKREATVDRLNSIFDGELKELCIQTKHPKQVSRVISACLVRRGELECGAGSRCLFVRDRESWEEACSVESMPGQILIAEPELDLAAVKSELLGRARARGHAIIYTELNPRPDTANVVVLTEPTESDILETLKQHNVPIVYAEKLARQSNGNVYILIRLLNGTPDRPAWLVDSSAYYFRGLALLGGWDDTSAPDQQAIAKIVGEPYESWISRIYPLTRQSEPPILLEGKGFRPISRYEIWQLLQHQLADVDLKRFADVALEVLRQDLSMEELEGGISLSVSSEDQKKRCSSALRGGLVETLAMLDVFGRAMNCSPNLPSELVHDTVHALLYCQPWERWASLSGFLPRLAEAAPARFLSCLESAIFDCSNSPLSRLFGVYDGSLFSKNYHANLLWALETLAWSPDYLSRVSVMLARMTQFSVADNVGNHPLASLSSIFLPWLPQTLASINARRAAVEAVIQENSEVGWKLVLHLLPQSHQIGSYNPKPVWRDWFPSDWEEGATRSEYYKQTIIYSELAVGLAKTDISKFQELIKRWNELPREVFQKVLEFLSSDEALKLPQEEKYLLWEELVAEVARHRKYADSDWAMPEEEVSRLANVAELIKPSDPSVVNRRFFDSYDFDLFETDDYEVERLKVSNLRERAIEAVVAQAGPQSILELARSVSQPVEVGAAAGRSKVLALDDVFLPEILANDEDKIREMIRGYVWSRYNLDPDNWLSGLCMNGWPANLMVIFFSYLPFRSAVWRLAESKLGSDVSEYWKNIRPNVFQAGGDLLEAARSALDYLRPDIAVDCIAALLHEKQAVPAALATKALVDCLNHGDIGRRIGNYHILDVIKYIQRADDSSEELVCFVEFHYLALLDRHSGGRPLFLERRLARDPMFFHEMISKCFRSEEADSKNDEDVVDETSRSLAKQAYRLLTAWRIPPGTSKDGESINENLFSGWFEEVKQLCERSGHWRIAQQQIGHCLMYPPAGLDGMISCPIILKIVDGHDQEHVRRGLTAELFNSRGVHGYSAGREELGIAEKFQKYASDYDLLKCTRIATSLRELAESYMRDSEREARRDPFR